MANNVNPDMAASSDSSAPKDKRSTRQTSKLTADESLEILQQATINCQTAGVQVQVYPLCYQGQQSMILVLANVQLVDGNFVLLEK